ncbi:hypothetical protein SAMN06265365_12324 [Tistlia consotensis]|uniref:Uncharacterized protein n=1 Tax=Tistlia consotensis USBA 355 TaxID=560819 RepID=A0A1Y6CIU3_9PROT|nr:hypothetical protein [Tistlia consotensis]SMF64713.1 hypothetical protein SAMN05428998_12585 [Tistlia consotensis USBA 355]SNR96869.1 hypothetical protein SAMN06265365_12324 [Tistlia consotensis]
MYHGTIRNVIGVAIDLDEARPQMEDDLVRDAVEMTERAWPSFRRRLRSGKPQPPKVPPVRTKLQLFWEFYCMLHQERHGMSFDLDLYVPEALRPPPITVIRL